MSFNFRSQARPADHYNLMNDPTIANARIYVGNIPTTGITRRDLEDRFEKHGNILGISLNRGFGFVQFEHENSALEAIKQEHGATLRGNVIEVNPARVFGGGARGPMMNRRGDGDERDNFRDRSPIDDRGRDRDWRDRFDNFSGNRDRQSFFRDGGKDPAPFSAQDKFRAGEDRSGSFGKDTFSKEAFGGNSFRSNLPENRNTRDYTPSAAGVARDYPSAAAAAAAAPVSSMDRTNDCEIIVFNKAQREYAEYIERRLQMLGLSVDILFPNEEVPIGRILANISSRGTLYAIVVMPQNEEHRSLTLNILHGLPQEHRNMPVEDAVTLIKRNFDAYVRGEKVTGPAPVSVPVVPTGTGLSERHPDPMQALLALLYENRPLTVLQYDRIIQYLQEKRELQLKLELGDAKDFVPTKEPATKQQVELQHRILNILNNQGGGVPSASTPTPVAPPAGNWQQQTQGQPTSTPLLNDPNVQKALDSLMQGNLLRKIGSGGPSGNNPNVQSASLGAPSSQGMFGVWGGGGKLM